MGQNFAELGAGLINDTPTSKRSIDFRSREKGSLLFKESRIVKLSKSNLLQREVRTGRRPNSRTSIRMLTKQNRASSRNLLNYGGLTHFNFI